MKTELGIWLDTSKAFIISMADGDTPNVHMIKSEVESRTRIPGERKTSRIGSLLTNAENKITNRRKQQKQHYLNEIIKSLPHNTEAIFLFGPSKTKIELEKGLRKQSTFSNKAIYLESADKMTERQMIAHVKSFFEKTELKQA
jgi:hypothetical protein